MKLIALWGIAILMLIIGLSVGIHIWLRHRTKRLEYLWDQLQTDVTYYQVIDYGGLRILQIRIKNKMYSGRNRRYVLAEYPDGTETIIPFTQLISEWTKEP